MKVTIGFRIKVTKTIIYGITLTTLKVFMIHAQMAGVYLNQEAMIWHYGMVQLVYTPLLRQDMECISIQIAISQHQVIDHQLVAN